MPFQHITNRPATNSLKRSAFTLVELVVVVAILAVVGVIVIPTVRTLNEDRKIRDTARVVGSVFAAARERAAVDGIAGVEIVSIPSNPGGPNQAPPEALRFNIPNMGLVLYQLRSIPPYIGDVTGATVEIDPGTLELDFGADGDPVTANVQTYDQIELNNSGVKLVVRRDDNGTPGNLADDLFFIAGNPSPNPPIPPAGFTPGEGLSYKIYRQPVRIESSAVRLPNNLFLNMALSGHGSAVDSVGDPPTNSDNQYWGRQFRDFGPIPTGHPDPGNYPVVQGSTMIWFASDGSVSRVTNRQYIISPGAGNPHDIASMEKPAGPIHLLMCTGEGDDVDVTNLDSAAFLHDDNNMWITINHRTGGVTMGKIAQTNLSQTLSEQLDDSRILARNRRSANP